MMPHCLFSLLYKANHTIRHWHIFTYLLQHRPTCGVMPDFQRSVSVAVAVAVAVSVAK